MMSDADLRRLIAERQRAPKLAANAFVVAVSAGDIEALESEREISLALQVGFDT
jgi:hypothetical protein